MAFGLGPSGVSLEESLIGFRPPGMLLSPGTYGLMSRMPGCGVGALFAMVLDLSAPWALQNGGQNRRSPGAWPAALRPRQRARRQTGNRAAPGSLMARPERRRWEETMKTSVQGRASAVVAGAGLG